ncbi:hypothetical protein CS379_12070, partial [Methylobacterium frigidaeris]
MTLRLAEGPPAADRVAALPAPAPRRALRAFLRNPTALSGLAILGVVAAAALAAPFVYPDDPLGMVAQPFLWP